jgi:hypothetical protein
MNNPNEKGNDSESYVRRVEERYITLRYSPRPLKDPRDPSSSPYDAGGRTR